MPVFPQVIRHAEYKGSAFRCTQIIYLKVVAPFDSSLKTLLLDILQEVDLLVGTDYSDKAIVGRLTINRLISQVQQILTVYHIGLLVIDEFQFLSKKSEQVLNFLTNIINNWGVSLYLVGTPPSLEVLQKDLRVARRFQLLLYENMKKDSLEWQYLLSNLWQYQYTTSNTQLNQKIEDCFYFYSQGITDILIKLFIEVQCEAIEKNKKITVSLIRFVAREKMTMMMPIIRAIQSKDEYQLLKYGDVLL